MEVKVNVYDIAGNLNKYVGWLGLGAYHTGVQVGSREYTFSNAGVVFHTPLQAGPEARFKESIKMGEVPSMTAINSAVGQLREKFAPGTYDLTRQNCNHFSDALCQALFGKSIPGYINRSARLGSSFAPKDTTADNTSKLSTDSTSKAPVPKAKPEKPKTDRPNLSEKQKQMLDKMKKNSTEKSNEADESAQ